MEKYPIAHYKLGNSGLFINGGVLTITDSECIVSYLKKEVVRLVLTEAKAETIPSELFHEGIRLTDSKSSIDLYFLKSSKMCKQVKELFSI